jgi:hypothetical protein
MKKSSLLDSVPDMKSGAHWASGMQTGTWLRYERIALEKGVTAVYDHQ